MEIRRGGSIAFAMPDEAVVITAGFLGAPFFIDYSGNDCVHLVNAPTVAREGEEVTVSFTVDEGYDLDLVSVIGDRYSDFSSQILSPSLCRTAASASALKRRKCGTAFREA